MSSNPSERIMEAVNELAGYNDRTSGKAAGELFVGPDILVVTLRSEPLIIEGECSEGDERADLTDMIDEYIEKDIAVDPEKRESGWW